MAIWKYDSAIKRGRTGRDACVREGECAGGDTARLLRPIKAQFKAAHFFAPLLRMPHSNAGSGGPGVCMYVCMEI